MVVWWCVYERKGKIGIGNDNRGQIDTSVVHIGKEQCVCTVTTKQATRVMNEKYFGTATTQSRIHAEIFAVSRSSYTYPIDQNLSYHARVASTVLTS
jgi:hypothetical protein